jgi:hypothetical protein
VLWQIETVYLKRLREWILYKDRLRLLRIHKAYTGNIIKPLKRNHFANIRISYPPFREENLKGRVHTVNLTYHTLQKLA